MSIEEYVQKRALDFSYYPTDVLMEYTTEILSSYLHTENHSVSKSDVEWMFNYMSSSEFIDCHNRNKISSDYMKGLKLLARIEYNAKLTKHPKIVDSVDSSMKSLERIAGCVDD